MRNRITALAALTSVLCAAALHASAAQPSPSSSRPDRSQWVYFDDAVPKHVKAELTDLRLSKDADGIWRPGRNSPLRNAAAPASAASLVVAEAATQLQTDIDGHARRAPADAGCDELSDDPVINKALMPRDVGPSWMLGLAGRETKARSGN